MIDIKEKKEKILESVSSSDLQKGINYYKNYIRFIQKKREESSTNNFFRVFSEHGAGLYNCLIEVLRDNTVNDIYCDCPQFAQTGSCKHIAACLYHCFDDIFDEIPDDEYAKGLTSRLFEYFKNNNSTNEKRFVKEEIKVEIELDGYALFPYENTLTLCLKVGTTKLYQAKERKLLNFLEAIQNKETYNFGKNFEYNPQKHYFSKETEELVDYLIMIKDSESYYNRSFFNFKGIEKIRPLLKALKGKTFKLNGYTIYETTKSFPLLSDLKKEDNIYKLSVKMDDFKIITGNLEYIQIKNTLYNLNENEIMLLGTLLESKVTELIFDEKDKDIFIKNFLPLVKNGISIDSKIEDIKISKEIKPKLYFDLYRDKIICNLKFLYDNENIDYFDKMSSVIRDKELEETVINDLFSYGFEIINDKILLEGIDKIGPFLETYLQEITEHYETYTSEKIKNINIVKNSHVSSTFSIGSDNIMRYDFDLGDIKSDEIVNVFESLKNKKKYFRLKSGDIINLDEDVSLQELESLSDEMNLTKKDLQEGGGEIPKYRAIYLDSLKDHKYHIVKTNNLFDDLITKFNEYKNAPVNLSKKEKGLLRNYQEEGVKWLYNIDKTGFGGILADEMGLGKSIQTIYYIKELLKENSNYKFLIVAPTSLAYNWENEFKKFEPNMKIKVMLGIREQRRKNFDDLDDTNILITTYGLLREDFELYENIEFKTIIIDEAQNIKNPNAGVTKTVKSIKASSKLALTGTPIENSITELWSIFDFIMPGFLGNQQTFESRYRVKDFDDDANQRLSTLNNLIHPFILRRRKKDVIKDLPDKIENNIFVELTKEQKKIYLAELERVNKEMNEAMESGGISKARFMILQLLTKLRQICIDPRILFENYTGGSGKMEEFINVIQTSIKNGHKILVFTSFKSALELARTELSNNGISSYTIDGSVSAKKRMDLVENFNQNDTNVFFIMLKAGGTGLNLTSADVVIHLDLWWNPQAENQATDRAHRIGQKNVVEVIHFISKGTIEEKILDLQAKKKLLSDKLIDENSGEETFSKLSEKDIKNLLSYENSEANE